MTGPSSWSRTLLRPIINRGNTLKELGQLETGLDSYNKAIQLKPDYAQAYYNRGISLTELGQLEAAVESYLTTIKIQPDLQSAWNNLFSTLKVLQS